MEEKKVDKRTLKTRKAIINALAELLSEKELRKITVQEIADGADVNRVTFYKHYLDIYDLYEQTEKSVLSELGLLILGYQENHAEDFSTGMVDYIFDNQKIFKMIFSPHNTGELKDKFKNMLEGLFRLIQSEKNNTDFGDYRLNYYCSYQANGCVAIYEKWIRDELRQPKDFIINTILKLNNQIDDFIAAEYK